MHKNSLNVYWQKTRGTVGKKATIRKPNESWFGQCRKKKPKDHMPQTQTATKGGGKGKMIYVRKTKRSENRNSFLEIVHTVSTDTSNNSCDMLRHAKNNQLNAHCTCTHQELRVLLNSRGKRDLHSIHRNWRTRAGGLMTMFFIPFFFYCDQINMTVVILHVVQSLSNYLKFSKKKN